MTGPIGRFRLGTSCCVLFAADAGSLPVSADGQEPHSPFPVLGRSISYPHVTSESPTAGIVLAEPCRAMWRWCSTARRIVLLAETRFDGIVTDGCCH